jgi:hypothetical protein
MRKINHSVYGTFKVTTEGDCEGKTTNNLGIYEGNISDIAFYLKNKCAYSLRFSPVKVTKIDSYDVTHYGYVNISLDIDSGTWNMSPEDRVNYFKVLLYTENRDHIITIEPGQFYASVNLIGYDSHEEYVRKTALEKLTDEEKEVLGLL